MDEPEFSYFAPDRLVGVLRIEDPDQPVASARLVEVIHLTSRFGAFKRSRSKDSWILLWEGWNPDPDLKYINFDEDAYYPVIWEFYSARDDLLNYEDIKDFQQILDWEGSFDNTHAPECLRDIEELVNWIDDFVEPRPDVITYGTGRVSMSDMAWMRHDVEQLEDLRTETEDYVLRQRRKPSKEVMYEELSHIELHPQFFETVYSVYDESEDRASNTKLFREEWDSSALIRSLKGEKVSMRELHDQYFKLLAQSIDFTEPFSESEIHQRELTRPKILKPQDRLEAWFIHGTETQLYQLVANTRFGLFTRTSTKEWRPLIRSREDEDIFDLAGVTILHLRPEREREIIRQFDKGRLQEISIDDPAFNRYTVRYYDAIPSGDDFYDQVDHNDRSGIKFSSLRRIGTAVIQEMVIELRKRIKTLREERVDVGILPSNLALLEGFVKNQIELSRPHLHNLLRDSFAEEIDIECANLTAGEFAARSTKNRFEELIEKRDAEYLPLGSLMLVVAYEPATSMWLEYRSQIYGSFARIDGGWKSGNSQDSALYKELFLYEVKEECVDDFITTFDSIAEGDGWATFEELAPMLCFYRISQNRAGDVFNPRDWDAEPFMRDQMPPSASTVVEYLFNSVMTFISDYSEAHEDDDDDSWMQVDEWLAQIWADHMIEFMNRESTLNRSLLGRFLEAAPRILQDPKNVIR